MALFGISQVPIAVGYFAIFFWVACFGVVLLNALWDPEFRKTKVRWLIREWYDVVPFILGMPLCMLLTL